MSSGEPRELSLESKYGSSSCICPCELTVFAAGEVELVVLQLIGEREEDAASSVGRGVRAIRTCDTLDAGRRDGRSEGEETGGELEHHCRCLRNRLEAAWNEELEVE